MKKILEAMYHLYFFKTYTKYPRWMEIMYGISAWIFLCVIINGILKLFLN
jgi:hypothetical protein